MSSKMDCTSALDYAERGWAVVPLHRPLWDAKGRVRCSCSRAFECENTGKHPWWDKDLLTNGVRSATKDAELIREWWKRFPSVNVGIATGTPSGFWALDVDGEEGVQTLRDLERVHSPLPDTVESKTGGGGRHLLFVLPGEPVRNKVRFAPGLDTRSDGGIIVVEPSKHVSGNEYAWEASSHPEDVDIQAAPAWLIDLVTQGPGKREGNQADPVDDRIPKGKRNATLTSLAGSMRRRSMAEDEILAALTAVNDKRCEPPLVLRELESIAKSVVRYEPAESDGGHGRRSTPDRLTDYAINDSDALFVDQHGEPHALVAGQPVSLNSRSYRWLRRLLWDHDQRSAPAEALSQAAGTLAAMASGTGDVRELHVRSAWHDEGLYVELAEGRVVRVDVKGWRMDENPPVLFRRFVNLKPLPDPDHDGNLDGLTSLFALRSDSDQRLLIAYITIGLLPHVARPILMVTGPGGSGKSTAQRVVKRLIDPTTPESFRLDGRDGLQKASHCAVVSMDNLSSLPDWASDMCCRLVTGEGDSKRSLWTNDDDFIYEMRRLILINGINPPVGRPDFLDRCLCVELERIPKDRRKEEDGLWAAFQSGHAQWLGRLFDLLSGAMKCRTALQMKELPRLADWGRWAAAVYEAHEWGAGTFMADWEENARVQHRATIEGSIFSQCILALMEDRDEWEGTATDLLTRVQEEAEQLNANTKGDKTFPKAPNSLSYRLRELEPVLVEFGVAVDRGKDKKRKITLRKVGTGEAREVPEKIVGTVDTVQKAPNRTSQPVYRDDSTDDLSTTITTSSETSSPWNGPEQPITPPSDDADDEDDDLGDFSGRDPFSVLETQAGRSS